MSSDIPNTTPRNSDQFATPRAPTIPTPPIVLDTDPPPTIQEVNRWRFSPSYSDQLTFRYWQFKSQEPEYRFFKAIGLDVLPIAASLSGFAWLTRHFSQFDLSHPHSESPYSFAKQQAYETEFERCQKLAQKQPGYIPPEYAPPTPPSDHLQAHRMAQVAKKFVPIGKQIVAKKMPLWAFTVGSFYQFGQLFQEQFGELHPPQLGFKYYPSLLDLSSELGTVAFYSLVGGGLLAFPLYGRASFVPTRIRKYHPISVHGFCAMFLALSIMLRILPRAHADKAIDNYNLDCAQHGNPPIVKTTLLVAPPKQLWVRRLSREDSRVG